MGISIPIAFARKYHWIVAKNHPIIYNIKILSRLFLIKILLSLKNERFTAKLLRNGILLNNLDDTFSSCQDNSNIKIPTTSRRIAPIIADMIKFLLTFEKEDIYIRAAAAPPTLRINSTPCGAKIHAIPSVIGIPDVFFKIGGVKKYPLLPGVISPTIIPPICERKTIIYFVFCPIFLRRYDRRKALTMLRSK